MTKMKLIAAAFLALIVLSTAAVAQGVLGNVVNWVLPGFGTVADDIPSTEKQKRLPVRSLVASVEKLEQLPVDQYWRNGFAHPEIM